MQNLSILIHDVADYARRRGVTPGYVCKLALGNFYAYERLRRRAAKTERDEKRLREYMASNPCVTPDVLAADNVAPSETDCQPNRKSSP